LKVSQLDDIINFKNQDSPQTKAEKKAAADAEHSEKLEAIKVNARLKAQHAVIEAKKVGVRVRDRVSVRVRLSLWTDRTKKTLHNNPDLNHKTIRTNHTCLIESRQRWVSMCLS